MDFSAACIAVQPKSPAMGFDDRSAQGQSDAEPLLLPEAEWQKGLDKIGWKSRSIVRNPNLDLTTVVGGCRDVDYTYAVVRVFDRFDRVPDDIEQGLLDLQHIDYDGRKVGGGAPTQNTAATNESGLAQRDGFRDYPFDVARRAPAAVEANQGTQPPHDLGGAFDLRGRLPGRLSCRQEVGIAPVERVGDKPCIGAGGLIISSCNAIKSCVYPRKARLRR